jgi:hypothetical protein
MWYLISDIHNTNEYFDLVHQKLIEGNLQQSDVEQLQIIEGVYESARQYEAMSFFYMFISTILLALIGYYYNKMNKVLIVNDKIENDYKEGLKTRNEFDYYTDISSLLLLITNQFGILENLFIQSTSPTHTEKVEQLTLKYIPLLRSDLTKLSKQVEGFCKAQDSISYSKKHFDNILKLHYHFQEKLETLEDIDKEIKEQLLDPETIIEFHEYIKGSIEKLDHLKDTVNKSLGFEV